MGVILCEICGREEATCFTEVSAEPGKRQAWFYACGDHADPDIRLPIDAFFHSRLDTMEELLVLHRRGTDWNAFMAMLARYYRESGGTETFE